MTPQPWTPPAADKQVWTPPVADAQAAPKDQPGYLSQVGTGLWNTVKGLYNVGAEAGGVAADPLNAVEHLKKLKQMVLDPQIDQAIKAGEKWKAGDRSEAVGHALAAVLPGIGPAAANIGEKLGDRDFTGAAADATVLGATMAAPRVAGAAMDVAPRVAAGAKVAGKVVGTGVRVAAPEVGAAIATAGVGELAGHVVPGAEWATRVAAGQLMRSGVTKGLRAAREAMKPAAAEVAAESLTPGQILAQQSGADWSKLSPSDQAILEHVAKAQAQANAAAQQPRPPMGPPQAPPEAAPVVQAPPPPMAGPISQVQQPVAPGTGAPQPAGVLQFPTRTPAMGEQMPAPAMQTSQMASEPTAPVVAPAHLSNRMAMAQRFAKGLQDGGITSEMADRIEVGHLGDSQMQAGMAPRWGNIAEYLGEKVPSELTIPQIIGELKKLEAARPAPVEAPPTAGPISQVQQPVAPGSGAPQPAGVLQFPSRSPEMGNGLPGVVAPAQRAPGGGMGGMKNYFVEPEAAPEAPAPKAPVNGNGKPKGKKSASPVETSPIADEIAAHIKQKTDNPLPWAKLVGDHGDAVQAFEKLLNGDAPNQAALAAAAAEVDRLAGPMEHELHGRAATLTAQDVAETHGKTVTGDPLPAPAPRGKNPDAMTPEEFRAAHAPEPITPTKELAKQPTKSAGKAPALTAEVEEQALRAWSRNEVYLDNAGNYRVKPTDADGHFTGERSTIPTWNRAIKAKYANVSDLSKAAQQYKPKK